MGISDPMFNGDLQRRVADLERQLRNLTSGRRLEDASVGARGIRLLDGGSLTVEGGGDVDIRDGGDVNVRDGGSITLEGGQFRLISPEGVEIAFFGNVIAGDSTSRGWLFKFDTGNSAFSLQGDPGDQFWSLRDEAGNIIISNDSASDVGLARPYLDYRIIPSFDAEGVGEGATSLWPSTTSGTPIKLMQGVNTVWNPRLTVGVLTATVGGGSTEWRLDIGGQTAATGTDTGNQTVAIPGWGSTINPGDAAGFDLYVNATGGATRVWAQVDRLHGNQS